MIRADILASLRGHFTSLETTAVKLDYLDHQKPEDIKRAAAETARMKLSARKSVACIREALDELEGRL